MYTAGGNDVKKNSLFFGKTKHSVLLVLVTRTLEGYISGYRVPRHIHNEEVLRIYYSIPERKSLLYTLSE